jgi:NDP-sugar pyrophosphorylase family protein
MTSLEELILIKKLSASRNLKNWSTNAHKVLEEIEEFFKKILIALKDKNIDYISPDASIHETSIVEEHVIIGNNVHIGPFSFIRNHSIILSNTKIGYNVEIAKSIIMQNTKIAHMACIGNSLIGANCNLGAGFIVTTRRLDNDRINVMLTSKNKFLSKRTHHGVAIGSNVQIGVQVITMPGSTIGENAIIYPTSVVSGCIPPNFIGFIEPIWKKEIYDG